MKSKKLLGIGAAIVAVLSVTACGNHRLKTLDDVVAEASAGERSGSLIDGATTIYGGNNVACSNLPAAAWAVNAITLCRLSAGDSTEATVRIPLEDASKAKRSRVVYLCDYTKVREVVTFRRELNLNWETLTRNHTDNPQCSTNTHLKLKYDPNNGYLAYDYDGNNPYALNHDVLIRIPGCEEAYGWLCPFYNNPSILVAVADYDPNTVTQSVLP